MLNSHHFIKALKINLDAWDDLNCFNPCAQSTKPVLGQFPNCSLAVMGWRDWLPLDRGKFPDSSLQVGSFTNPTCLCVPKFEDNTSLTIGTSRQASLRSTPCLGKYNNNGRKHLHHAIISSVVFNFTEQFFKV